MRKVIDEKGELGYGHRWTHGWALLVVKLLSRLKINIIMKKSKIFNSILLLRSSIIRSQKHK